MKTQQTDPSLLSTCWSSQLLNTAYMKPLFISVLLAALCFECRTQKDNVLQPEGDETAAEGETLTLGCLYNSSINTGNYLYWYKQDGNNSPKFILSRVQQDDGNTEAEFKERFSSTLDSTIRSVPLKIQKLHVSDSAVYYCALRPGGGTKITFGSGTRLTVEPRANHPPSYYALEDEGKTEVCLATGFSKYKATGDHKSYGKSLFNNTEAVLISSDSLYNQVIFTNDKQACEGEQDDDKKCVDALEPDPTVNLVSLTILGLRVIFLKTIIFNVLMTLRLWISS